MTGHHGVVLSVMVNAMTVGRRNFSHVTDRTQFKEAAPVARGMPAGLTPMRTRTAQNRHQGVLWDIQ
jgi:hypothetical protein